METQQKIRTRRKQLKTCQNRSAKTFGNRNKNEEKAVINPLGLWATSLADTNTQSNPYCSYSTSISSKTDKVSATGSKHFQIS